MPKQHLSICLTVLKLALCIVTVRSTNREMYGSSVAQNDGALTEQMNRDDVRISRPIEDCIFMALEEGHYHLHASGEQQGTCGVYVLSEPDKQVVITFDHVDVGCVDGGLVSTNSLYCCALSEEHTYGKVVDGWENSGEFFPGVSEQGKSIESRYHEFCGTKKPKKHYLASQNAAMIQYRIPHRGQGFRITIQFIKNLTPCNVILQGYQGIYTLRNYGQRVNCSVAAIFPAHVDVISLSVGVQGSKRSTVDLETGIRNKCQEIGSNDYVNVVGTNGMDPTKAKASNSLCGLESNPRDVAANVLCGTSTVRLVSSGMFENSISVRFRQMDVEDLLSPHLISCDSEVP